MSEFRRVVDYEVVLGPGGSEYFRLQLACGHREARRVKAMRRVPKMVRCGECERAMS